MSDRKFKVRPIKKNGFFLMVSASIKLSAEGWARKKGCKEMASDSKRDKDTSLTARLTLGYEETSRLLYLREDLG